MHLHRAAEDCARAICTFLLILQSLSALHHGGIALLVAILNQAWNIAQFFQSSLTMYEGRIDKMTNCELHASVRKGSSAWTCSNQCILEEPAHATSAN